MFGPSETAKMAMFNIKEEQKPVLKTFLIYLNYLPEDKNVGTPLDSNIIEKLRNI
jgi:hypothetical protein